MDQHLKTGPLPHYRAKILRGELSIEPAQMLMAENLQLLHDRLGRYRPPSGRDDFFNFFKTRRKNVPKGLYLYGGVGRGKTMLMDMFFETTGFAPRKRVHFHAFMQQVHSAIGRWRRAVEGDPIPVTASEIARDAALLCIDEFQVGDIADAMILGRLFSALFDEGVVVVATSNTAPDDLYQDGLNRGLFLPFIDLIKARMEVLHFDGERDYRLDRLRADDYYHAPLGEKSAAEMEQVWARLTSGQKGEAQTLQVKGRLVQVPRAACGAAFFDFAQLCGQPLGAVDYLAIAQNYHALFLANVPVMDVARRNEAKRFITLIDALYDAGTRLIISAAAEPHELYVASSGAGAFERTASRLVEMRSG